MTVLWTCCRCWSGTGLDRRVLGMLLNLVDTSLDPKKLKIFLTGDGEILNPMSHLPVGAKHSCSHTVVLQSDCSAHKACTEMCPALLTVALALCLPARPPARSFIFLTVRSLPGWCHRNTGCLRLAAEVPQARQAAAGRTAATQSSGLGPMSSGQCCGPGLLLPGSLA